MRLIDADKLIMHLADYALTEGLGFGEFDGNKDAYDAIENCIEAVKEQPTVDEINVCGNCKWARLAHGFIEHGHWIIDTKFGADVMSGEQMVICSVCGRGIFWGKQNYCPNCGAKMDEESK